MQLLLFEIGKKFPTNRIITDIYIYKNNNCTVYIEVVSHHKAIILRIRDLLTAFAIVYMDI